MYKNFRKLLDKADVKAQQAIVVNIDVRGFSAFCKNIDSINVGLFIREVYKKLIDEYFSNVSFIKPTGDGLLLIIPIIPYTEDDIRETVRNTMNSCLKLTKDFSSFFSSDDVVNFSVPDKIGIGISRGPVCHIISDDRTIDYSSSVINLASRLMGLARPHGIVFSADLGIQMLLAEMKEIFTDEKVYLPGIAEKSPIEVYYSKSLGTRIMEMYTRPLDVREWTTDNLGFYKFKHIKLQCEKMKHMILLLSKKPIDPNDIVMRILMPEHIIKKEGFGFLELNVFQYKFEGGESKILIKPSDLMKKLQDFPLADNDILRVAFKYPI